MLMAGIHPMLTFSMPIKRFPLPFDTLYIPLLIMLCPPVLRLQQTAELDERFRAAISAVEASAADVRRQLDGLPAPAPAAGGSAAAAADAAAISSSLSFDALVAAEAALAQGGVSQSTGEIAVHHEALEQYREALGIVTSADRWDELAASVHCLAL